MLYLVKCGGVAVGVSTLARRDPAAGVLRDELCPTAEFELLRGRVLAGQDLELLDEAGELVPTRRVRVYRDGRASGSKGSLWLEVSLAEDSYAGGCRLRG